MTEHVKLGYNIRRFYLEGKASPMDRITEGFLTEFSNEFGFVSMPEKDRFERFCAWLAVRRHYSESTFSPEDLMTGAAGGDTGIDAIAIIVNNNLVTDVDAIEDLLSLNGYLDVSFVFIQASRSAHFEASKIGTFGFGVKDFFGQGNLIRNEQVKNYAEIMKALYDKSAKFKPHNPTCHLYYVTTGKFSAEADLVTRAVAEINDLKRTELFSDIRFYPVGADNLHRLYRASKNSISREFNFDKKVVVPEVAGVTAAYLGFLSAKDLLKLVCDEDGEIIKSLFYENVRDFLGVNAINAEIILTAASKESDRFILMNNGVTMITRLLQTTGDKFAIGDFQIVNGCQTTHVLHALRARVTDSIRVPFRLIHTQNESVIEDIIRATNRQTEVKEDQFFAMRDFAKKLEAYFKTFPIETRLYYERRPHQYDSTDIEKIRIITHQNLVRSVGAMFLGLPQITTRRFSQLSSMVGNKMFCDTDKPEPYYVAALALYRLEQLFKNKSVEGKYKAARYQILLTARMLIDPAPLPHLNSHEMTRRSHALAERLQNEQACENLFKRATEIVDSVVHGWNRDTIRNESSTKAIFNKFGQHYSG